MTGITHSGAIACTIIDCEVKKACQMYSIDYAYFYSNGFLNIPMLSQPNQLAKMDISLPYHTLPQHPHFLSTKVVNTYN